MLKLKHSDILSDGTHAHLTRAILLPRRPKTLHTQDYFQILWVQNGRVRHHLPDGRRDLHDGDMVFVRPGDKHALQGRGEAPMIVALSIDPAVVRKIGKRHPSLAGHMFWSDAATPPVYARDSVQLAAINQAALLLEQSTRDLLATEAFLAPILASLRPHHSLPQEAPDWLLSACAAARDPRIFQDGAAGFVRTTGRSHAHVSRSMRQWLGQSPSDYVNTQRMSLAAARLTGSEDTLSEIAEEIGIPNLSHFHKVFRAAHGMTPQKYRKAHQRDVLQPT